MLADRAMVLSLSSQPFRYITGNAATCNACWRSACLWSMEQVHLLISSSGGLLISSETLPE